MPGTVIIGSGSYIPTFIKTNLDFEDQIFYDEKNQIINLAPEVIVAKFQQITGIEERRYAPADYTNLDLAYHAALLAIDDAAINPETIDQIIFAHNYGEVQLGSVQSDSVPSLAARLKHRLGIINPSCVGYDILFGCPGWLQGVIIAEAFFMSGQAKRIMVVGAETLSRVIDHFDRDSLIFSDGAGVTIFERTDDVFRGILATSAMTHAMDELSYIDFGCSYNLDANPDIKYIKMKGRKVYEYALTFVPQAMKSCLDKAGVDIRQVKKILIHQANEKMDEAILKGFYKLYDIVDTPPHVMPMSIHKLGNSSVATIPTLFDLIYRNQMPDHKFESGDILLFASVGAGMHINAFCYRY